MKAIWVFSIITALENRLFYLKDNEDTSCEKKIVEESLEYFRGLNLENKD